MSMSCMKDLENTKKWMGSQKKGHLNLFQSLKLDEYIILQ